MKKRYLIKLAPADEKVKISEKGDMELLREIETIAIKSLFETATQSMKMPKEIYSALDSAQRVENLMYNEDLEIDEEDLEFINKGLEVSVNRRPHSWVKCVNLFKQLSNPEEYKDDKEA